MFDALNKARGAPMLVLVPVSLCLSLAACGKGEDTTAKQAAGGDLLERSVGDDMLPYDALRSQPSLADPDAALYEDAGPRARPRTMASGEASEAVSEAPATATPSASPATEAE